MAFPPGTEVLSMKDKIKRMKRNQEEPEPYCPGRGWKPNLSHIEDNDLIRPVRPSSQKVICPAAHLWPDAIRAILAAWCEDEDISYDVIWHENIFADAIKSKLYYEVKQILFLKRT